MIVRPYDCPKLYWSSVYFLLSIVFLWSNVLWMFVCYPAGRVAAELTPLQVFTPFSPPGPQTKATVHPLTNVGQADSVLTPLGVLTPVEVLIPIQVLTLLQVLTPLQVLILLQVLTMLQVLTLLQVLKPLQVLTLLQVLTPLQVL